MRFSVCIPTIRPGTLGHAVRSIRRQTTDDWELVVIGQGDEAGLRAATEAAAEDDPRVRYVHLPRRGLSAARNAGMAATTGELIAFLDDDCEAAPDWLVRLDECFGTEVGFVAGTVVAPATDRRGAAVCPEVEPDDITVGPPADQFPPTFAMLGADIAVRRTAAERVGGFDECLGAGSRFGGGEEHDFAGRLLLAGSTLRCSPAPVVHHTYGYRYGLRAVYGHKRDRMRGDGALAAKRQMIEAGPGGAPPSVTDIARRQLRTVRLIRLPNAAFRLWFLLTSYRECVRDYTLTHPGGEDVRAVLAPRSAAT